MFLQSNAVYFDVQTKYCYIKDDPIVNRIKKVIITASICLCMTSFSSAKDLIDVSQFPAWFQEASQRDSVIETRSSISIPKYKVDSKVVGKFKLISDDNGVWYYNVDIGTDSPVECYVFEEFDGTSNSLKNVIEASIEAAAELNEKPFANKYNYAVDVGVIKDTPYLALDTFYSLGEGNQMVSGVLKAYSSQTQNTLQICVHNEIGYRKAFFSVFESFINAFVESESTESFFEVVYQMTINDLPVGYGLEKHSLDADGDVYSYIESSMMIPVDASNVSVTDSVETEWSSPTGSIINADQYVLENGRYTSQLALKPLEGKWKVTGELQGKTIDAFLTYEDWLLSSFGAYLASAYILTSEDSSLNYNAWVTEADPTTALPLTISKTSPETPNKLSMQIGPIKVDYVSSALGVFDEGSIRQGPVQVNIFKIYQRGEPSLK